MKLPNIPRFITDFRRAKTSQRVKLSLFLLVCSFLLVVILGAMYQLFESVQILSFTSRQRDAVIAERAYWEDVIRRHEGYRDAYFKAGVLSYQLGARDKARLYVQKALEIDPEFEEARDFVKKVRL